MGFMGFFVYALSAPFVESFLKISAELLTTNRQTDSESEERLYVCACMCVLEGGVEARGG